MKTVALAIVAMSFTMTAHAGYETKFWQERIDAVGHAGGGRVTVPRGRHVVGQLYLRSNVELHLEEGAFVEGAVGLQNYVVHRLPYSEGDWCAVVMGLNVTNVAITGRGEIFGNGASFEQVRTSGACGEGFRPRGIFFSESKGIRLENFKLRDAACWGVVFKCCEDVLVRHVTIDSNVNHNNDGFDIEARNVLIEDCDVDSGDDAYCVKSNNPNFTVGDIVVRNCIARSHCNGLKIGTATHGTIRGVRFERCKTERSRRIYRDLAKIPDDPTAFVTLKGVPHYLCGPGISAICIECVDGGTVEDVTVHDIEVQGFQVPIFVRGGARRQRVCNIPPSNKNIFRDIVISNVYGRAESAIASSISGCQMCYPKNIRMDNINIACRGGGRSFEPVCEPGPEYDDCYPEATMFREARLPAFGMYVGRAEDVVITNVHFSLLQGETDARDPVFVSRRAGISRVEERHWADPEELARFKGDLGSVYTNDVSGYKVRRFWKNAAHTEWVDCNYDERAVKPYVLDNPFVFLDGRKVKTPAEWKKRRDEILELLQSNLYGRLPPPPKTMIVEKISDKIAEDEFTYERRYRIWFRSDKSGPVIDWIVFVPRFAKEKVPVVLHLNYKGNDLIASGRTNHYKLPLEQIAARGYAFMSAQYTQISADPKTKEDWDESAYNGVFELWGERDSTRMDNPGAIMAWAWGLMRGLDLAERISEIDTTRSAVIGSSRLGKVALVAAAFDERFKVCIPNQTGAVGVQIMKRNFGENAKMQEFVFPHWYCKGFWKYRDDPSKQPFDQHLLLACVAPRALLLECFLNDWFDPKGEFESAKAASPVWELLVGKGLGCINIPEPFSSEFIIPPFGYASRDGAHGLSAYDWMWAMDFTDRVFGSWGRISTGGKCP